ncbi:hypothetical protein GCM10029963_66350 [Micromonospora andamanensis]
MSAPPGEPELTMPVSAPPADSLPADDPAPVGDHTSGPEAEAPGGTTERADRVGRGDLDDGMPPDTDIAPTDAVLATSSVSGPRPTTGRSPATRTTASRYPNRQPIPSRCWGASAGGWTR